MLHPFTGRLQRPAKHLCALQARTRFTNITVSESAALEEQISVGSFTLLLEILLDSIFEMVNSSFSVPRQESPVREAFNHAHTCHCSVRTYSWGHFSSITFQERKKPFLLLSLLAKKIYVRSKIEVNGR